MSGRWFDTEEPSVERALRARPADTHGEATDQDRYYDSSSATAGALSAWPEDDPPPWTDVLDDHEREL